MKSEKLKVKKATFGPLNRLKISEARVGLLVAGRTHVGEGSNIRQKTSNFITSLSTPSGLNKETIIASWLGDMNTMHAHLTG